MKSFDDWFCELISNYVWAEPARMHHKPETFRDVSNKVYMQYVASEVFPPIQEARRHVYNKLALVPGDKPKVDWTKKALEKIQAEKKGQEWVPLTGEERAQRLAEWEAIVKGSTMANSMPKPSYKQLAEEGGVLPPKPAPYPSTSFNEAYAKEKHIAYVKANYDPRTREKLPGWIPEEEFVWISKKQFSKTFN